MRDPKRIQRISAKLAELWRLHPDQRFFQLVENYIVPVSRMYHEPGDGSAVLMFMFNLEDDVLERRLDELLAKEAHAE